MEKCVDIDTRQLKDFKSLNARDRAQLQDSTQLLRLPKGTRVFDENEHLSQLFCIKKGACKFSKLDKNGREHILRFLGKGEVMGKRSIITNKGAKVSATTITDTQICCLQKVKICEFLEHNTNFCNDFLEALVEDANINDHTRIVFYSNKGIKQRLASLLLYLSEKYGVDQQGKILVHIKREDMAAVLGTSQEYIINLLKKLKNLGLITISKGEIYLKSLEGLKKITE